MKPAQYFALIIGIFYIALGVAGLLPNALETAEAANLTVDPDVAPSFGYLFGILPVNNLSSSINLLIGLAGVLAAIALDSSRVFSGLLGIIMALGAVLGLLPFANTLFGLTPLFSYQTERKLTRR